ncbi:hypothetical protein Tco_0974588 [Tanacetum coccineum]|uniref:Uncharacterized protein n=1 Tax=Tanacetum coccineum TaxID=301880 RepID=A0ABQ5EC71_9ASTR
MGFIMGRAWLFVNLWPETWTILASSLSPLTDTDGEMCMFAITVSRAEPKNIIEVMADHAWIEAMQEELHQFE